MAYLPARLDRRATILAPEQGRDSDGGPATFYIEEKTLWCQRLDKTAKQVNEASALRSEVVSEFTFRYFEGLTAKHRLRCEGRVYDIQPPREVGRRQWLVVEGRERSGQ